MTQSIEQVESELKNNPRTWLVTGAAGFIGSNLVERLLGLGQQVVGMDNFATGHKSNLDDVCRVVGESVWKQFAFIEGDITDCADCSRAVKGVDYVLHQAALGSVPRSIKDPLASHRANINGFLNMLLAARDAGVSRFVYASSSSVYGDEPNLPKTEGRIGRPLSPYALTKHVNELYADVFSRVYELEVIGLRYFNVFGPRQDPNGAYAAVIPRWIGRLLNDEPCMIYGDGATSRDFCFVDNAVQANILAALTQNKDALGRAFNVAVGERTTLNELYRMIFDSLAEVRGVSGFVQPQYIAFREGDIAHSLADISEARELLAYQPKTKVTEGLGITVNWYTSRQQ